MSDKYVLAIDQGTTSTRAIVFDAAGAGSDVARDGRRRLSSILFS